jgi:hypothetical protein
MSLSLKRLQTSIQVPGAGTRQMYLFRAGKRAEKGLGAVAEWLTMAIGLSVASACVESASASVSTGARCLQVPKEATHQPHCLPTPESSRLLLGVSYEP